MSVFKVISDKTHNDFKMLHAKINYMRDVMATNLDLLYGAGVARGIDAFGEFMDVKAQYNQVRGKGFFHFIFAPEEGEIDDVERLYEAGMEMANAIEHFEGWYQVLMAVHVDHPERLHVHFIANNIDLATGERLDLNLRRLFMLKKEISGIAERYGISKVRMYEGA